MAVASELLCTTKERTLANCSRVDLNIGHLFRKRTGSTKSPAPGPRWLLRMPSVTLSQVSRSCRWRLRKRRCHHMFLILAGVFLLLLANRLLSKDKAVTIGERKFEESVSRLEPPLHPGLNRPLRIPSAVQTTTNGLGNLDMPRDHSKPFVFTSVGVAAKDAETNKSQTLLFLYTQGTVAWSDSGVGAFHLNVTSCMVNRDRFPVIYQAGGVYTCAVDRDLVRGEKLSVLVSPNAWVIRPPLEDNRKIMRHLAELEQLDDGSFIVGSNVVWNGQTEPSVTQNTGRYRVCMMTQEKTFPEYIPEWVAYHRRLGVDYVYIYDNNGRQNLSETYKHSPDIEIVDWPWQRSQIQAQNHFLLTARSRCQWGLLIDVDEYVMLRQKWSSSVEQPLKKYLRLMREVRDYSQIRLTSIAFGSSGLLYRPREPMAEAYWHVANIQDNLTKPFVWIGHSFPDSYVHHVTLGKSYYSHTTQSALNEPEDSEIALCHMKYRSWEDYVLKGRGGRNSFLVDEWSFSSNWSVHSPRSNHMMLRNQDAFTGFRKIWRRTMLESIRPPELAPSDDVEQRYKRVERAAYVWKRRRGLGNSTLEEAILEKEKYFRELKDWERKKKARLAKMGIEVEF